MEFKGEFVLAVLPLLVCLYWFVRFAAEHRRADAAKKVLTVFFAVCSVLYLCHALLFHLYAETGLPTPLESLWAACSLSVYPIYFLYICRLTAQPASPRLTVQVLAPGLLVALAILCWNNETTDSVRQVLNALQVLSVVIFGYRRLRAFDRKLSELYAETEDKSVLPIRILLVAVLLTAIVSFVLNILGRKYVITNHGMIPFALVPMAVLLFVLGYIGSKRSFRVEQFLTDNPEETPPDAPAENKELGAKIEHLMVTEAYYLRQNVTLTDVAREVGSCRTYVSNYINQELRCSFSDYVNRLRIEHAKMMMMQHDRHGGESKFSSIAQNVGFSGEQSFYRNFRKFTGMTPLAWLEQQRGKA
ncbi:MAG: helix-turn-helix transcriptional regulator [Bacteroidaceae bacterium]|nr:helix-turn-helix transcriptional regulator [Bacteroidaceae bacterium]